MRVWFILPMLAGCQLVFPLGSDEDGDGQLDTDDGCPHIANQSDTDTDGDGVPDDCDLSINRKDGESHVFYSFFPDTELPTIRGSSQVVDGGLELGDATADGDDLSFVDLAIETYEARIEIGFTVIDVRDPIESFSEFGVHAMATGVPDTGTRGYTCFFGRDTQGPPPNYLIAQQNEVNPDDPAFSRFSAADLVGFHGTLKQTRIDASVECQVVGDSGERIEAGFTVRDNAISTPGTIAFTTSRIRVRIDYIWAVSSSTPL
ncbi:MAG: hypothetical protein ABI867_04565 [Kofleriaceae bacterium]